MRLRAIGDNILCTDGDFGDIVTAGGLVVKSNIGTAEGITPRWFQVFEVGPEIDWIESEQWVYVDYGRWTEALNVEDERFATPGNKKKIWKIDPKGCLAVSDEAPAGTLNFNTESVGAMKKTLY